MSEIKTFGELCLHDKIYWVSISDHSYSGITKIEEDEDDRSNVVIELSNGDDPISFPEGESFYVPKDFDIKYTTDKNQYLKWIKPFILNKIAEKEKRIEELKQEIFELNSDIVE